MRPTVAGAVAIGAIGASTALGAVSIEFRIVERTGQSVVNASDNVLNFAVQARVSQDGTRPHGLGNFNMSIQMPGESESNGVLSRDRISNLDNTYFTGFAGPAAGTSSGLAHQYNYLSTLNSAFNGLINANAATWTQDPATQDIGLIAGSPTNGALLGTPGVDADEDGNPDTAVGNLATLPSAIMAQYFGAGQFVDIYRFRYTVSVLTARTISLVLGGGDRTLALPDAQYFDRVQFTSGAWNNINIATGIPTVATGITITVVPSVPTAFFGIALVMLPARRNRRSSSEKS